MSQATTQATTEATTQVTIQGTGRSVGRGSPPKAAGGPAKRDVDVVMEVLAAAAAGVGGAVLLHHRNEGDSAQVLHAALRSWPDTALLRRCAPTDRDRHLGLFRDTLRSVRPAGTGTADLVLERLESVLASGPLLLAVDEPQWADDASLAVLQRLTNDLVRRPLAVLITAPTDRPPAGLRRLIASLERQGVLTEVALAGTALTLAGGTQRSLVTADVPSRALDSLPADTVELLRLAALLEPAFTIREMCVLTGQRMTELLRSVREALAAGVLTETDDGRLCLRHDALGDLMREELPAGVRAELHRDLARRLDDEGAAPRVVAAHLLRAPATDRDVDWLTGTALRVQSEDPAAAIALWEQAVRSLDLHDDRRASTEAGLAEAMLAAGRLADAERVARRALTARTRRRAAGRLSISLTTARLWQGRWSAARTGAEAAGEAPDLHPFERADQLALASTAALLSGERDALLRLVERADRAAVSTGAVQPRAQILGVRGHLAHLDGDLEEAARLFEESRGLSGHWGARYDALLDVGYALLLADRDQMHEAHAVLADTVAESRADGWLPGVKLALMAQGALHAECGALDRAVDALDASGSATLTGDGSAHPFVVAHKAAVALQRQGPAAAAEQLAAMPHDLRPVRSVLGFGAVASTRAAVRLAEGDQAGWVDELRAGWTSCLDHALTPDLLLLGPDVADAAHHAGDTALAESVVTTLAQLDRRNPGVATVAASASASRALAGSDVGLLLAAVVAWRRSPRTLRSAHVAERVAHRLAATAGQADRAVALRHYAGEVYLAAGAAYAAQQARGPLRRSPTRSTPTRPIGHAAGWEVLTRTERVVAGYVERGESNAQIADRMVVSRRTVETHVSHILTKLRLRSRADLIIAAAQRGRLPGQVAVRAERSN